MTFLVDTNVISELARPEPDLGVAAWASRVSAMALSAVSLEEIRYGLAWKPKPRVQTWFDAFLSEHCTVLAVTPEIAILGGQLRGGHQARGSSRTQADMLIAATAQFHGLTVVTRNVDHFADCTIAVLNPFL